MNEKMPTCEDCLTVSEDVITTNCPFAEEINDALERCQLCSECYRERCMDI
jgi:hypothetical protein